MIDFAEIERLDFRGTESRSRIDAVLGEVAGFAETRTAAELAGILQKKQQALPSLRDALTPLIVKFQTLALPLLTDDQVVDLVRNIGLIIADERISMYERLRARLLILPPSRRQGLSQKILAVLRASPEPLGTSPVHYRGKEFPATVGSWVELFERLGGPANPSALFALPDFQKLPDELDHAVRHLIHIVPLLLTPESVEGQMATKPGRPSRQLSTEPAVPPNLPIESTPTAAVTAPPPGPRPAPISERGPTRAQVLARLQRSAQEAATGPPTVAHLTPDDEEEITGHSQRLAGYDIGPNVHDTLVDTIQHIMTNNGLKFDDEHLQRRLVSIVTARLKDIRSSAATLDLLTRAPKIGGMGLDRQRAESIVAEASIEAAKFHDQDEVRRLAEQQRRVEPTPPLPKVPSPPPVPLEPPPSPSLQPAVRPMTVAAPPRVGIAPAPMPLSTEPSLESSTPTMPTAALRTAESERPWVADIKGLPRLTGPIEELKTMNVTDFRRLGPDPTASVRRVYDKIQRLGKESFTKKAEGIRAWRESDVYQLYVAMGQESLLTAKTIRDVIVSRQQGGQPSLSEQEFVLIADLNRKLRF